MAFISFYDATDADQITLSNKLKQTAHHVVYYREPISLENLNSEAEVISIFVSSEVTAEIINKLPKLRLIACRSTGYNNVDIKVCKEKDITVVNVPTYGEHTVAEYTFGLMLALSRKIITASSVILKGSFSQHDLTGIDLHDKTLGIIGAGKIGQNVACIAKGFGMKVIAYDPYPNKEVADKFGYSYVELDDLLQRSDIITIHAPYVPSNKHLIDAEAISKMKNGVLLINTSRSEIINNLDLISALQEKRVGGVALDVFDGEKIVTIDEELLILRKDNLPGEVLQQSMELLAMEKMPNVILSPHNAYNSIEAIGRIDDTTVQNIIGFWYGDIPNAVKAPDMPQAGKLIVARHGESEWNALGKWTGTTDVHLSEKGFHESSQYGQLIAKTDINIDYAFCSEQIRTLETLEGILNSSQQFDVKYERIGSLNERDYGDYTGKNKWEMRDIIGEEEFNKLHREWNYPVPNGETLKTVYERVIPFYEKAVTPRIIAGENVLIVAHGNSIRALIKYIEDISDDEISNVEMLIGAIVVYDLDNKGKIIKKQELKIASDSTTV